MGSLLESLRRLQEVHSRLSALRQKEETRLREVRLRKKRVDECKVKLEQAAERIRAQQMQIDEVDLEVKTREASIGKHREDLNRAKTNREYAAILTALNTEKADVARFENRTLELMTAMDTIKAEKESLQEEYDRLAQKVLEAESQAAEFRRTLGPDMERLTQERAAAATTVAPEILVRFERSAERHDGEALAAVVKPHPKREEYSCGACNMGVTLQQRNALAGGDEIQLCHVCGAILYLPVELKHG